MRVLSIGSDEKVFERTSAVRSRQVAYASELGRLDLVVLSKKAHQIEESQTLSIFPAYAQSAVSRLLLTRTVACGLPKPDIVTVQDPFEIGVIGWLVARHFGVPLHVQVHTDFLAPTFARQSLLNRIRIVLARFVLKRATRIRVVSESIKASIAPLTSAPVNVLPIFTDLEELRIAPSDPTLIARFKRFKTKLLVVARLEPEKNVRLAVNAFAKAAPQDACLLIVGNGSERANLERQLQKLGIADRVFLEGEQPSLKYYPIADLVLVPSKYEGYGLVIVEALAAGKPVLSTDVGIAREAGAIVSSERNFARDLKEWFASGPRSGELKNYPYENFDEYLRMYCGDIRACVSVK